MKVKFGLKNVYYALANIDEKTNTATYGTPVRYPGAVSLSLEAQGENSNFFADDGVYFTTTTNNGYEGDFEVALIPDDFKIDVLKDTKDENGVIVDNTAAVTAPFAFLFEFTGDTRGRRHVMYNCTATRPAVSSQTKSDSAEPATETMKITAKQIHNASLGIDMTKAYTSDETDEETFKNWFDEVYQPTAIPDGQAGDEDRLLS